MFFGAIGQWFGFGTTCLLFLVLAGLIYRRSLPIKSAQKFLRKLAWICLAFSLVAFTGLLVSLVSSIALGKLFLIFYATSLLIFGLGFLISSKPSIRNVPRGQ